MSKDSNVIELRPIDKQRCDHVQTLIEADPMNNEVWFMHSTLAQCFLPYRDQKDVTHWVRENGKVGIAVTADSVKLPDGTYGTLGLPFGAKPRLFLSKLQTEAVRTKSAVIPVENSMTGMMKELGFQITGGKTGTISSFKEQTARLAACRFRFINEFKTGHTKNLNTDIFSQFELWFPQNAEQQTLWPTEIVLTDIFLQELLEHAIPYDYRALKNIRNNARAQDIYYWMTQRLYRVSYKKPLFLTWKHLYLMFGGGIKEERNFPAHFKKAILAACTAYPEARVEEHAKGFIFKSSPPPISRTRIGYGDKSLG